MKQGDQMDESMKMDQSKHDHHEMNHSMNGHDHHNMNQEMNGHDHHEMAHGGMDHSMHMGNFKQKFWLSLVLSIPIIVLSPMMGMQLPFQFTFPGSEWVV